MSECGPKGYDYAVVNVASPAPDATDVDLKRSHYRIDNMDCLTEGALIHDRLATLPGVVKLEFNPVQRSLIVNHRLPSSALIEQALSAIGMQAVRVEETCSAQSMVLTTRQMGCPTGEALIQGKLAGVPGVAGLDSNFVQCTLAVRHAAHVLPQVLIAIQSLGFDAEVCNASAAAPASVPDVTPTKWWPLAISGANAVLAEVVYRLNSDSRQVVVALALAAILTGGFTTYKKSWIALKNRNLNMSVLMSIAVTGVTVIGHWPGAVMVTALFVLTEVVEARSLDRARNVIRGSMDLAPETVMVQRSDGSWGDADVKTVVVGSRVRVKLGERIALDGEVSQRRSSVNQALITGESLSVEKTEGDPVFAGIISESGSFEYRVAAAASDSTLAHIVHTVEAAQGNHAPTQRFVDQFARLYTPTVFAVAPAVAILLPPLFDAVRLDWIYKALILLVIARPCTLVISTPVSIVSGLTAAVRRGTPIKDGAYLEEGRKLKWLALGKTGTITHGEPALIDVMTWSDTDPSAAERLAASPAICSDHPVSQAVTRAVQDKGLTPGEVADLAAIPGRGVRSHTDGALYHLGNHRLVEGFGVYSPASETNLTTLETQGKTVVMLIDPDGAHAPSGVADTIKDSSRQAIKDLHVLGIKTVMLSGDNSHTAEVTTQQVGVGKAWGSLLPEDKQHEIEQLSAQGTIGMIGDDINNTPTLARVDIGFAMGAAGTDAAIETANVALMDDDLRKLPAFVWLSRSTAGVPKQNIVLALDIKAVFLVLTFTGQATMWMVVFVDMRASLLVVGNGLRLLCK